jgi:membrane-associated phospholipid phosphatase
MFQSRNLRYFPVSRTQKAHGFSWIPFLVARDFIIISLICVFNTIPVPAAPASQETGSPLEFSWPRETALLATGLTGQFIGQYRLDHMAAARPDELRRSDLSPLDRWNAGTWNPGADAASDYLALVIGPAMVYADVWHTARGESSWRPVLEDFLVLAQASAWNSALNLNVRATRVHPRPYVYGTAAPESERRKGEAAGSFYSGHASGAFLGAVYVSTVYPLRHPEFEHEGWLWAGSLTVATGVSALRVVAGKHFPSDVLAGAAMGSLVGLGFVQLHLKDGVELWGARPLPLLTPEGGVGMAVVRRL